MNTAIKYISDSLADTANEDSPDYLVPTELSIDSSEESSTPFDNDKNSTAKTNTGIKPPHKFNVPSYYTTQLRGRFKLLQAWEGRITKVFKNEVEAIISDKTNPEMNDELVIFSLDEFSPSDKKMAVPGAVFYWSISYADMPGRGRIKESQIRFRRLQPWTQKEIERAKKAGIRLAEKLARYTI